MPMSPTTETTTDSRDNDDPVVHVKRTRREERADAAEQRAALESFYKEAFRQYCDSVPKAKQTVKDFETHLKLIWPMTPFTDRPMACYKTLPKKLKGMAAERQGKPRLFACGHTQSAELLAQVRKLHPYVTKDDHCPTCVSQKKISNDQQAKDNELQNLREGLQHHCDQAHKGEPWWQLFKKLDLVAAESGRPQGNKNITPEKLVCKALRYTAKEQNELQKILDAKV